MSLLFASRAAGPPAGRANARRPVGLASIARDYAPSFPLFPSIPTHVGIHGLGSGLYRHGPQRALGRRNMRNIEQMTMTKIRTGRTLPVLRRLQKQP